MTSISFFPTLFTLALGSLMLGELPSQAQAASATRAPFKFKTPTYEKAPLPTDLNTAEAWQTVAQNAQRAHDYNNSLAAFGKAIDLAFPEQRPKLFEKRGWVHYLLGRFDQAQADFRMANSLYRQQN